MGQDESRPRKRRRPPHRRKTVRWDPREVDALVDGVRIHGVGKWATILRHSQRFNCVRTSVDLKDKWRNLTSHKTGIAVDLIKSTSTSPAASPHLVDPQHQQQQQQSSINPNTTDLQQSSSTPNLVTDGLLSMSPTSDTDFQKNVQHQLQSPLPSHPNLTNTKFPQLQRPPSESSVSPNLITIPNHVNQNKQTPPNIPPVQFGPDKSSYFSSHPSALQNSIVQQPTPAHEIFNQNIQTSAAALSTYWRQMAYDPSLYPVSSSPATHPLPSQCNPYLYSKGNNGYIYPSQDDDDDDDDDEEADIQKLPQYRTGYPQFFSNSIPDYTMSYGMFHPTLQPSNTQHHPVQPSLAHLSSTHPSSVHASTIQNQVSQESSGRQSTRQVNTYSNVTSEQLVSQPNQQSETRHHQKESDFNSNEGNNKFNEFQPNQSNSVVNTQSPVEQQTINIPDTAVNESESAAQPVLK